MKKQVVIADIVLRTDVNVSIDSLCKQYDIPEQWLYELMEYGFFHESLGKQSTLDLDMVARIQTARRLQLDLEINTAGIVVVMELLEELEHMRHAMRLLERLRS